MLKRIPNLFKGKYGSNKKFKTNTILYFPKNFHQLYK